MGKRRIEIEKIENRKKMNVSFTKRRQGLFKKADQLSRLCNSKIAIIVYSNSGNPYIFGDLNKLTNQYFSSSKEDDVDDYNEEFTASEMMGLKNYVVYDKVSTDQLEKEEEDNYNEEFTISEMMELTNGQVEQQQEQDMSFDYQTDCIDFGCDNVEESCTEDYITCCSNDNDDHYSCSSPSGFNVNEFASSLLESDNYMLPTSV